MNSAIETGTGEGYLAKVNSDGSLQAQVGNVVSVEVTTPVDVQKASRMVFRTYFTALTTSDTLLNFRAGRQGLWVQNRGANPCFLRFEDEDATDEDWLVASGGEFRAEDMSYQGVVTVITTGGSSDILALEFVL